MNDVSDSGLDDLQVRGLGFLLFYLLALNTKRVLQYCNCIFSSFIQMKRIYNVDCRTQYESNIMKVGKYW